MQLNRTDLSEAPTPQLCVELDTAADRPTQIGINLGRGKAFLQEVNIKNLRERQGHYARDFLIGKKLDPKGDFLGGTGTSGSSGTTAAQPRYAKKNCRFLGLDGLR